MHIFIIQIPLLPSFSLVILTNTVLMSFIYFLNAWGSIIAHVCLLLFFTGTQALHSKQVSMVFDTHYFD